MMFRLAFDALFWFFLLDFGLIAAIYHFRAVNETAARALILLVGLLFSTTVLRFVRASSRIRSLGKLAPNCTDWSPFGLSFIINAVRLYLKHQAAEFWLSFLNKSANPRRPHTVETHSMGQRIIFTVDEDNIKAILATQFADYGKGPQFRVEWKDFLGLSIFTTDGELWHNSRQLLRPQFIKDRVSDLKTFEHHTQELLPLLAGTNDGATVRCDDLFYRYTLDAATSFLLGSSVGSLKNGESEFASAFSEVQRVQGIIARAGPLRHVIPKRSFYESLDVFNKFIDKFIDQALALPPEELEKKTKSDDGYTFLHAIAAYTRDRSVLRDQIAAVLLAGRDTTAVTLSWLFYEVSKSPEVVAKLRQEILNVVGLERHPTYADLKSMRYLQHTLNETLRLYPVVPYNLRVSLEDTTIPRGGGPNGDEPVAVLKDTPIGYSPYIMQRRADIYPPESATFAHHLKFSPERWDHWTPTSWTYIPFNGGPRICIGQQFALTEMAYTVVRILQTFDTVECRMNEHPGLKTDIVLQPEKGVFVAFRKGRKV